MHHCGNARREWDFLRNVLTSRSGWHGGRHHHLIVFVASVVDFVHGNEHEGEELAALRSFRGKPCALEVLRKTLKSLHPSVADFANLLRVEEVPLALLEELVEAYRMERMHKVDECITKIAPVAKVDGQIEKVKGVLQFLVPI